MIAYLDSNCVIYFVERVAVWWPKVAARLAALRAAGDEIAVSDLARTECLVGPLVTGSGTLLASFQAFFADPDIRVFPLTPAVCERAARIRAAYRFKLPDALHLAAAIEHGCGLFLTNDAQLARCTDIAVEVLA
ncbi:MAG: PIN domain-containing protein [Gemmataceae bacterium]|nr:PIN domain-containing protein [Gemmataceae bacterium]